jgi:thiol:disulfide interchange protein DsbA
MFARFLAVISLFTLPLAGHAADVAPAAGTFEAGKQYFVIDPPQPTNSDKIEVTEVFSYACPHCNATNAIFEKIKKNLPANAVMTYVPAGFNPSEDWPMFQRAYYTAQALGVADKAHSAMFDAVWKKRTLAVASEDGRTLVKPAPSIEDAAKFYAQFGVKPEDFVATANSFAINTQIKRADAFIKATGVDSTPTLIVAGKYRLNFASAGSVDQIEQLVQYLIAKESAAK